MWSRSCPTNPEMDEMFTMAPPPACRMAGAACFMPRKTPLALTPMMLSHDAVLVVSGSDEPLTPALVTQMARSLGAPVGGADAPLPLGLAGAVEPREARLAAVGGDLGRHLLAGRL